MVPGGVGVGVMVPGGVGVGVMVPGGVGVVVPSGVSVGAVVATIFPNRESPGDAVVSGMAAVKSYSTL